MSNITKNVKRVSTRPKTLKARVTEEMHVKFMKRCSDLGVSVDAHLNHLIRKKGFKAPRIFNLIGAACLRGLLVCEEFRKTKKPKNGGGQTALFDAVNLDETTIKEMENLFKEILILNDKYGEN